MKLLMWLCVLVLTVALFVGCANYQAAQQVAVDQAAQAADQVRETAELALCRGITVGAWIRAYGSNPAKAEAWRQLCSVLVVQTPAR